MRRNLLHWMWTAAALLGLLAGGVVASGQTPTAPRSPNFPQAPSPPQAPTIPEAPTAPDEPTAPLAPTAPQTPTAPQMPTAPQAPTAPIAAVPPPGFNPTAQPYGPNPGAVAPTPMGGAQRPYYFNATNPMGLAGRYGSDIPGGIRSPNRSVTTDPRLMATGGAPLAFVPDKGGLGWLWWLFIACSLGVTFFFARKIWVDRGAAPSSDGEQD